MTEVLEAIRSLRDRGARLLLHGDTIRVSFQCPASELQEVKDAIATIRDRKPEAIAILRHHQIPTNAVLLAPRYNGNSNPLASIPKCWCCKALWELDKATESKGKTYAWLKPGCGCLDAPQALACCGLCVDHCRCKLAPQKPQNGFLEGQQEPERAG